MYNEEQPDPQLVKEVAILAKFASLLGMPFRAIFKSSTVTYDPETGRPVIRFEGNIYTEVRNLGYSSTESEE
jgi:hypothetical protein